MRIINQTQRELLAQVDDFFKTSVLPHQREWDEKNYVPLEAYQEFFRRGLHTFEIDPEYGGLGVDNYTKALLYEQVGYYDLGIGGSITGTNLALKFVKLAGTQNQIAYFSKIVKESGFAAFALTEGAHGSDAAATEAVAVRDGDYYVLTGRKDFVTNAAEAAATIVIASTDPSKGAKGLSAFIVENNLPGISVVDAQDKMGFRGNTTASLIFDHVRVPADHLLNKEGSAFKYTMMTMDQSRACCSSAAVGLAQRCLDEALAYAKQRVVFGKPIVYQQGIQWMLADMEIKVQSARQMVYHVFDLWEKGLPFNREAAICKYLAPENAVQVALNAIQITGGYGYTKAYPIEKLLRDAKALCIAEGTSQVMEIIVSSSLLSGRSL